MNITKVQIHLNKGTTPTNKIKAWADIILDDEFIVRGLAIREHATEGYCFVTMPYKTKVFNHDEVRQDVAHPINSMNMNWSWAKSLIRKEGNHYELCTRETL